MKRGGALAWSPKALGSILGCECAYCGAAAGIMCSRRAAREGWPRIETTPHRPRVKAARIKLLETGNGR